MPKAKSMLQQQKQGSSRARLDVGDSSGEGAEGEDHDPGVPRLVVMDLDFTLWHPELYQMRGSPFRKGEDGKVRDRSGTVIDLFPGVREILLSVHRDERFQESTLAIASRTEHERWAREVMALLELEPGVLMRDVFTPRLSEIYRGTKVRHLGELRKNSGVPYEDMIFFDDWDQNCKDVGKLGVTCIECPRGLNKQIWNRGLNEFRAVKERLRS